MNFIKTYYESIVKYDLINKFNYSNTHSIPKLTKIVLTFKCKTPNLKNLVTSALALRFITNKTPKLILLKNTSIFIKLRKGSPIGCTLILKKKDMYVFLTKLLVDIFPKLKNFYKISVNQSSKFQNSISYNMKEIFNFVQLGNNYLFFENLSNLQITFVTNTKSKQELFFLFKSLKIPINFK